MNGRTNREASPADILLRYLWIRRTGTGRHFRDVSAYCFGREEKHVVIARRLCALGHVEFDWDGGDLRWRVVPPSFYRIGKTLGLCGILPREEEERISKAGIEFECYREEFGSTTILRQHVIDADGGAATQLKGRAFMYSVAHEAYYDLLQRLPSIGTLLARQLPTVLPKVALRFNLATRRFDQEILDPEPGDGLLKELGYGKSTYYYNGKQIDLTSGLWLAMAADPSHVARCTAGEIEIPVFPELPPLFERVLYFAGGRRETIANRIRFRDVDHGIAPRIAAKLGMRVQKEVAR